MLQFITLKNTPILEQLQLEEALLRTEEGSFCIINQGSPSAIVMGISGRPEQLIDLDKVKANPIPLIRRFSGGGTVVIDENTLFISFIIDKKDLNLPPFPEPILRWSADLYQRSWQIPDFHLRENDYVIGDKKCGGNAQYLKKDRWVHHTSFLWDFNTENMNFLTMPTKRPLYRENRTHIDFLCKLKDYVLEPEILSSWEKKSHRQATHLIDLK